MIDLKLSKQDKKKLTACDTPLSGHSGPEYPYGFSLDLDAAQIKKLKLSGLEVGEDVAIRGVGKITGTTVSERDGDDRRESMSIQIQQIGIKSLEKTKEDIRSETADRVMKDM